MATTDFARVEVAGVLRKKGLLAGRLTPEEFAGAVRVIDDIGVTVYETTADRLEQAALLSARRILVFIEHGTRRMHLGGVTTHPTGDRTVQQPATSRLPSVSGSRTSGS